MHVKIEEELVCWEDHVVRRATDPSVALAAMGLTGESGEYLDLIMDGVGMAISSARFSELVKKDVFHSVPIDRDKALKELGDVFWYLTLAVKCFESSLEEIAILNVKKLRARFPNGHHRGVGNREGEGA